MSKNKKKPTITEYIGEKVKYDPSCFFIWGVSKEDTLNHLADVRGWGRLQNLFDSEEEAAEFHDQLGEWMADAINEKLKRELKK